MEFQPDMQLHKDPNANFITTFSNSPCWSNYCLRQSYPEIYPFENNPKKGSFNTDLPKYVQIIFWRRNNSLQIGKRDLKVEKVSL